MGYYIEVQENHNKAAQIDKLYQAVILNEAPRDFADVPVNMALICVVDNGLFEAAGYVFSEAEFGEFSRPEDIRPKTWLLMDKTKAEELTGFDR